MSEVDTDAPLARRNDRDAIVRELARLARDAPRELAARIAALPPRELAEVVLRLPARERLELLLHAPQPMRLVRILPDSEVYLTIREIGPSDALPLLALASADQIIHLIDLESWRGDRYDADRSGAWVAFLLEAGEPSIVRFWRNADEELLALLFARWMGVRALDDEEARPPGDEEEEESRGDGGILAPDGQHQFHPTIPEHGPAIRRIAEIFHENDPHRYARILRLAQWELPSALEEDALRWRLSRLDEHGFPDLDSALSVYGAPEGLKTQPGGAPFAEEDALRAPRSALRTRTGSAGIALWLDALPEGTAERVLFEMTAVANRILVADRADTGDLAAHRAAMERAASFVGIACAARGVTGDAQAVRLLEEVPVLELFREGFARAAELQSAARRLIREGWPKVHPRATETLDQHLRAPIATLLERRPRVADSAEPGGRRDFRSEADLTAARGAVELAEVLGRVATGRLGWDLREILESLPAGATPASLGAIWLTSLGRHLATGELGAGPIPPAAAAALRSRIGDSRDPAVVAEPFLAALRASGAIDETESGLLREFLTGRLTALATLGTPALLESA